jgi:hypothetical protein
MAGLPSVGRQKAFIVENAGVLDRKTKLEILAIVMMEVGPTAVTETGGADREEVNIDLSAVAAANAEVLGHLYNIVQARLRLLSQPARLGDARN